MFTILAIDYESNLVACLINNQLEILTLENVTL